MMDGSAESVVKVDSSHDDLSLDGLGRRDSYELHCEKNMRVDDVELENGYETEDSMTGEDDVMDPDTFLTLLNEDQKQGHSEDASSVLEMQRSTASLLVSEVMERAVDKEQTPLNDTQPEPDSEDACSVLEMQKSTASDLVSKVMERAVEKVSTPEPENGDVDMNNEN